MIWLWCAFIFIQLLEAQNISAINDSGEHNDNVSQINIYPKCCKENQVFEVGEMVCIDVLDRNTSATVRKFKYPVNMVHNYSNQ